MIDTPAATEVKAKSKTPIAATIKFAQGVALSTDQKVNAVPKIPHTANDTEKSHWAVSCRSQKLPTGKASTDYIKYKDATYYKNSPKTVWLRPPYKIPSSFPQNPYYLCLNTDDQHED